MSPVKQEIFLLDVHNCQCQRRRLVVSHCRLRRWPPLRMPERSGVKLKAQFEKKKLESKINDGKKAREMRDT